MMPKLHRLPQRWCSETSPAVVSAGVTEVTGEESRILFRFRVEGQASLFETAALGQEIGIFREGLWRNDVAEVFLSAENSSGTAGYIEVNVSPSGSCWAARFGAPREQLEELPEAVEVLQVTGNNHGWELAFSLSSELVDPPELRRGNLTAILGDGTRSYFSQIDIPTADPDFHRPECFTDFRDLVSDE